MAAGVAAQIDAAQVADMAVVIQVTDNAHILPDVLSEAERLAGSVYLAAGVRIVWTEVNESVTRTANNGQQTSRDAIVLAVITRPGSLATI